jgi:Methyltransferase domain
MEAHLQICFDKAKLSQSKLPYEILNMPGMSGHKTRHFYNNLLTYPDARYLEIGTWKGSSVCSAMYGNKAKVVCIDNWREFGGPKEEFLRNFEAYRMGNDATFIEQDCWKVDPSTLGKFNIYMYDGGHTYDDHYRALKHYIDCMDDTFIFVVDDWNWADVRNATMASIADLKLSILHEYTIIREEPHHLAAQNWHNGIGAFVLKKH